MMIRQSVSGNPIPSQREIREELLALSSRDVRYSVIGQVVDAYEGGNGSFYATIQVDAKYAAAIRFLVEQGLLRGLSLTSMETPRITDMVMPYELSVCYSPLRPECYIEVVASTLRAIDKYKRAVLRSSSRGPFKMADADAPKLQTAAAEAAQPAAPATLKDIVNGLPEDQRRMIVERMGELYDVATKADGELNELRLTLAAKEKELAEAQSSTADMSVQAEILKGQIEDLQRNIGGKFSEVYHLETAGTTLAKFASSTNPETADFARFAKRLICASNDALMEMRSKMAKQETTTPAPEPASRPDAKRPLPDALKSYSELLEGVKVDQPPRSCAAEVAPSAAAAAAPVLTTAGAGVAGSAEEEVDALARLSAMFERKFQKGG